MSAYEYPRDTDGFAIDTRLPAVSVSSAEVQDALEQMLCSDVFIRARRMCRLLRYLVEQALAGKRRNTSEIAIGLEVFDRDPAEYYPAIDPVVRVQVGRLRERLQQYYARCPGQVSVQFSIPVGSYWPVFKRCDYNPGSTVRRANLEGRSLGM